MSMGDWVRTNHYVSEACGDLGQRMKAAPRQVFNFVADIVGTRPEREMVNRWVAGDVRGVDVVVFAYGLRSRALSAPDVLTVVGKTAAGGLLGALATSWLVPGQASLVVLGGTGGALALGGVASAVFKVFAARRRAVLAPMVDLENRVRDASISGLAVSDIKRCPSMLSFDPDGDPERVQGLRERYARDQQAVLAAYRRAQRPGMGQVLLGVRPPLKGVDVVPSELVERSGLTQGVFAENRILRVGDWFKKPVM